MLVPEVGDRICLSTLPRVEIIAIDNHSVLYRLNGGIAIAFLNDLKWNESEQYWDCLG